MLTYRLPQFIDYLNFNYHSLYERYIGRLVELFPSFSGDDNNLAIVHQDDDNPKDDEMLMKLWKRFSESL